MPERNSLLPAILLVLLLAAGCDTSERKLTRYTPPPAPAMGTEVRMTVVARDRDAVEQGMENALAAIERVEALMSTYRPDSEVSRINAAAGGSAVAVSPPTAEVIRLALDMEQTTGGAFDVTYAPLRSLWRRAAEEGREPTDAELQEAAALVGVDRINITEAGEVSIEVAGMELDLGGIAKGYAIDRAAAALREAGATGGIVDIGHDLLLFGSPEDGGKWRVGVRRPPGVDRDFVLEVGPCAVTTSGDYERGFMVGDKWFSHIIDPRTGRPATDVTSVTVVGPDATSADALATALSVMGPQEGLALVERLDEFECLFMTRLPHGSVEFKMSSGFGDLLAQE